jgi:metal-sulfur cluster biosynthetic enzyme
MNQQAMTAFQQYKELVNAWGRDVNMEAYENGCQLIQWINDQATGSTQEIRQDVQAVNLESVLSVIPTEAIMDDKIRRSDEKNEQHSRDKFRLPCMPWLRPVYDNRKNWKW